MPEVPKKILYSLLLVIPLQWTAVSFSYDFPQMFEAALIQNMGISTFQIEFLYSVGSLPNLVSNIFAAMLINCIGIQLVAVIFQAVLMFGVGLTFLAVRSNSYTLILIGRVFVGLGFDLTFMLQLVTAERWFSGKFLTFSYGIGRSFAYIATALSYFFTPRLFLKYRNLETSVMLCMAYSTLIFITTSIYAVIDLKNVHYLKLEAGGGGGHEHGGGGQGGGEGGSGEGEGDDILDKEFTFKHLKYISFKSWLYALLVAMFVQMYYQFTNTATDLLTTRFGLSFETAKNALAIIPLLHAVLIPIFSALYVKYGLKPLGVLVSSILGILTYLYLSFLPSTNPGIYLYLGLVMFSIFFSMFAACLWSCLVISVPKQSAGLMIALASSMQNFFYTVLPMFFSLFYGPRTVQAYQNFFYAMMGYCGVCMVLAATTLYLDLKGNKILMMPENDIKVKQIQMKQNKDFFYSVLRQKPESGKTEYATLGGGTGTGTTNVWRSVARSHAGSAIGFGGDFRDSAGGKNEDEEDDPKTAEERKRHEDFNARKGSFLAGKTEAEPEKQQAPDNQKVAPAEDGTAAKEEDEYQKLT